MAKVTLTTINDASTPSGTSAINSNFTNITNAIENTLSRDGTIPNQLTADLDVNNNDVMNVGNISTTTLFVDGVDVHDIVGTIGPQGPVGPSGPAGTNSDMLKAVYDPTNINASPFVRTNHTGTQAISTVTGLQTALDDKQPLDSDLTAFAAKTAPVGAVVGTTDTQTLTSKTLTSPVINTPTGIVKADVGLGSVDNTSDASKPVSTATTTQLNLKAPLASPAFTGTPTGITKAHVGLSNVDDTADTAKPVSTAQQTALNLKANLASPTFTGTVSGITSTMVGLGNVTNTSDANKPVSTAQQTALNLKANLASPTLTTPVLGVASATSINFGGTALANYVEAPWTPILVSAGGGTPTYGIQIGSYERIGRQVTGRFTLSITGAGTLAAGFISIGGLPLTSANVTNDNGAMVITRWNGIGLDGTYVNVGGVIAPNTTTAALFESSNAAITSAFGLQVASISATTFLIQGTFHYHV